MVCMCHRKSNLPLALNSNGVYALQRTVTHRASGSSKRVTMKKNWPKLVCVVCNKEFSVKPYRKETAKTCSFKCKQTYCGNLGGIVNAKRLFGTGTKWYLKVGGRHQHRVVMEEVLGRKLESWEIVHHKDENKHNNSPENLQIMTASEHAAHHFKKYWAEKGRKIEA